jgi:hypothetical protein
MNLANYINDLLYRYDCVIVPDFGGFVTNKVSAKLNNTTHTFYPPTKQISFNSHLKHNDGLLANYISSAESISFENANQRINDAVSDWKQKLETQAVQIDTVGSLMLNNDKQLVFEPNTNTNFLTESFGLNTVNSTVIERFTKEVKPLIPVNKTSEEKAKKGIPAFVKYAATAAILLTVGTIGFKEYSLNQDRIEYAKEKEKVDQKIQSATFVIDNPLPTINLNIEKVSSKEFHVIAGSFQQAENAEKKLNQLLKQGYNARILGVNKWGLIQVAFDSYETKQEAKKALYEIKDQVNPEAWLLIQKFD